MASRAAETAEEIAALRGTRPATLKDLLTHPSFSRLWRAMLVSSLGDWVGFVAVASLVARLGGARVGALAVAGVMLARLLPSVLFGPFAGVLADRFDRRKLMVSADIARGTMYASMPFLPSLWLIFLLSFCIESLSLLWTPAKDASIPNLVPRRQLSNANSIGLMTTYGTLPLGGLIYTVLAGVSVWVGVRIHYFAAHREFLALWLDAFTFFFSARMVWGLDLRRNAAVRLREETTPKLTLRSALQEAREGYRFLAEHPLVRAMTVGIVTGFAGVGAVIALGPVFALHELNAPTTGFGFLITAFGIGMGAGLGLMNYVSRVVEKDKLTYTSMIGAAGCLFLLSVTNSIALASLVTIPIGIGVGLAWVSGYTLLQENVSDEFRGRTFATLTISARMTLFAALVAFPALAAAIGIDPFGQGGRRPFFTGTRISLWVAGMVVVVAGLFTRLGLKRTRLARPRPLTLVPHTRRPSGTGVLIAFEGVEGSGKGTQLELARRYVQSKGRDVVVTREPGGTGFGDQLRGVILDPATGRVHPRAEALVFAAARTQHVSAVIRPAMTEGKVVLCDRFVDSSVAYQGVGRGVGEQDILTLNAWATEGLFPDLVILLHIEPEEGLRRAGENLDRIEAEELAFHAKVGDAYLRIAEEHPDRFQVIDATGTPEEVHERVRAALDRVLWPDAELDQGGRGGRDDRTD
jgi:dTMP kinase